MDLLQRADLHFWRMHLSPVSIEYAFLETKENLNLLYVQAFDELLLLKRGGRTIYNGPMGHESSELIAYFESIDGVPRISQGYNPATWCAGHS